MASAVELDEEIKTDQDFATLLRLCGIDPGQAQVVVPTATARPRPPQGPAPVTRRDRMREMMRAHPEKGWRALELAEAIGEPQNRQSVAQDLADMRERGQVEKVEAGVYRWKA